LILGNSLRYLHPCFAVESPGVVLLANPRPLDLFKHELGSTREGLLADIFISFIHEEKKIAEAVKAFLGEKLEIQSDVFLASDMWTIYACEAGIGLARLPALP
jgi:hypothetical protein